MSYATMGSKVGSLLVESTGRGGSGSDAALNTFQEQWAGSWVNGRLMLSHLHLTFLPSRAATSKGMLKLETVDVTGVEIGPGLVTKTIGVRTEGHLVQFRCTGGADKFAEMIAQAARDARDPGLARHL
ncbi:hypothetical protein [Nocardioides bruguierae]|uniref:hypothetical protein n=1 Tax=Nocardioides bruguierae TaxID=2945102 RepID=UPI0020201FD0|nr:hypothetical protein [Nocardioides bruguierae]MCL8026768.1 hypothetical protein [Nocardioides bruguierae]